VWLITAAHVVLGQNPVHGDWAKWPEVVSLLPAEGIVVDLELFRAPDVPGFAFLGDQSQIADFIARPLPPAIFATIPVLAQVQTFDLDAACLAFADQAVRIFGHPTDVEQWPERPAAELRRQVIKVAPELIQYSPEAMPGTSGGPVLNHAGALVGMSFGHNHGVGRIISAGAMKGIMDTYQFDIPPTSPA